MSRFVATPASEELASFLEGLPPGAHAAVDLGGLDMDLAVAISRQVARGRGERFIVVAHRGTEPSELGAASLMEALPLESFAAPSSKAWVVVDAASSIGALSARQHAEAETRLGVHVAPRLTVVCFYTAEAVAKVERNRLHTLHAAVATPGQV